MSTPFGPQLIGETEKTLNALLRRYLEASDLTEPQWVTLRLADVFDGSVNGTDSPQRSPTVRTTPTRPTSSLNSRAMACWRTVGSQPPAAS